MTSSSENGTDGVARAPLDGGATYSVRHRLHRVFWRASWLLFASWTPAPLHGWRRLVLRCFGARITGKPHIYGSADIWLPANLTIGHLAALGPHARCYNMAPIHIGEYAVISQYAFLCAGYHDIDDPSFPLKAKAIYVGRKAWVAAGAFVGPGVTLGEGSVVGAHAVLAGRNAKNWTVYAGNPAREVRLRTAH